MVWRFPSQFIFLARTARAFPTRSTPHPKSTSWSRSGSFADRPGIFVALEAELPNRSDFKSSFIGDTPVVITRNDDGSLSGWGQSLRASRRHGLSRGAR